MERSKALALLGLDDEATLDEISDALDQAVFQVRDHFLRQPVIPILAESRVKKCAQWSEVARALEVPNLGPPVPPPELMPLGDSLEASVLGHVENLRRCRSAMASTLDPESVAQIGHLLASIQSDYMEAFMALTKELAPTLEEAILAREEADWMALLAAIRAVGTEPGSERLRDSMISRERARMQNLINASLPTRR